MAFESDLLLIVAGLVSILSIYEWDK